jgi:LmbE family N-acetylglucosaminyl deacetylase
MKALCLVAHPDDCLIFAYSYIYNHCQYSWTIGYLTYTQNAPRGQEIQQFWRKRNIDTIFLGFDDHWHDNEHQTFTRWSGHDAITACRQLASNFDLVLTHGANGEYGHIHHKLVHHAVKHHPRVICFADLGEGQTYSLPTDTYSLDEIPLHAEIVKSFHKFGHVNSYKDLV